MRLEGIELYLDITKYFKKNNVNYKYKQTMNGEDQFQISDCSMNCFFTIKKDHLEVKVETNIIINNVYFIMKEKEEHVNWDFLEDSTRKLCLVRWYGLFGFTMEELFESLTEADEIVEDINEEIVIKSNVLKMA